MRLRIKFILLVLGITILPFLAVLLTFAVNQGFDRMGFETSALGEYIKIQRLIRVDIPRAVEAGNLAGVLESLPESTEIAVFDSEGRILLTNGFVHGVDEARQFPVIPAAGYERQVIPYLTDSHKGWIVVTHPHLNLFPTGLARLFGLILPLSLLLFSALMSVLIVRSIRRSISALEGAATRIANGNLDFELEARGSDEIASLTKSFDTMRRRLKEEYARRARFIMGVSHDLKTPLTLIEGYIDAIEDGHADTPEKLHRYINVIKEKSQILEHRIAQLIEFAKMETEGWKASHQRVRLKDFLGTLARRYHEESSLLGYGFTYELDIEPSLATEMDPELVTRAFENILNNAIQYSDPPKQVRLRAVSDGGTVVVSVTNHGRGILPGELPYIFDPFYRGSNSRREHGSGFGLTMVKSVIEAHGWDLRVESEPGGETTFAVEITPVLSDECSFPVSRQ